MNQWPRGNLAAVSYQEIDHASEPAPTDAVKLARDMDRLGSRGPDVVSDDALSVKSCDAK